MCIANGIGLVGKAIKKGGVMGAISPALAIAGAFNRKKKPKPEPAAPSMQGGM